MWSIFKPILITFFIITIIVSLPYLTGKIILAYRCIRFSCLLKDNQKCQKQIDKHTQNILKCLSPCRSLKNMLFLSAYKRAIVSQNLKEVERLSGICCQNVKKGNNPEAIEDIIRSLAENEKLIIIIKANKQKMYRTARLANFPLVKFARQIDKL